MLNGDLFHEDIYDAIGATIEVLGGFKRVAGWLFPNKAIATSYAHLKNCLRDDKPEKLDPFELMLIVKQGRDKDVHYIINFMAEQANYTKPEPVSPENELMALQKKYIEATEVMQKITQKITRVQVRQVV